MFRTSLSMDLLCIFSIIVFMATLVYSRNFDVTNYGAIGNEKTDDSQAFLKAWGAVCGSTSQNPTLIIPTGKTFLLGPITFQGPCKSFVAIQILGNIVAPSQSSASWKTQSATWILLKGVKGLNVTGNGQIYAKGAEWWKSCSPTSGCRRPTTIRFQGCSSFYVSGLTLINSGRNHISIDSSDHGDFNFLTLLAPGKSPNTDGIDIASSNNIRISESKIATGDDCVAINGGTSYVNITNVRCGPGHGISIGSLGKNGATAQVEEIHVKRCRFYGTQNGARIRTWQGGSGYAKKISFEHIKVFNSYNPIIIDQYYCIDKISKNESSAVQISDVWFSDITGNSKTANAIQLKCSKAVACTNINVENVFLTSSLRGHKAYSSCINAHGTSFQTTPPVNCLVS